ncbi:hypothetical protein QEH57_17300 [Pelagicoccus sp. SDUM812005]|nr:hypothetical protein [Pelagicoccus sp. SDUM812005]
MMKGKGVWSVLRGVAAAASLWMAASAVAEDQPEWELTVAETNTQAVFEAVKLHPKEDAWLLTCRMRVKSLNLIPRVSEIEFKGVDAEEEVVWEHSHTIRSKDFEAAYGGGRSQFVRVFLRDVPPAVAEVQLHYLSEEESE